MFRREMPPADIVGLPGNPNRPTVSDVSVFRHWIAQCLGKKEKEDDDPSGSAGQSPDAGRAPPASPPATDAEAPGAGEDAGPTGGAKDGAASPDGGAGDASAVTDARADAAAEGGRRDGRVGGGGGGGAVRRRARHRYRRLGAHSCRRLRHRGLQADSAARAEWGWLPRYDLPAMTVDMLDKLKARSRFAE
jgi:hypothetical protein